jgi:uncharacterized membrane protein YhfC
MKFEKIGTEAVVSLAVCAALAIIVPIVIALIWKKKKNEKLSTILVGAATFFLFVFVLEKPIQNVLIFPTTMGLQEHGLSRFINARPVLLAFLVGLFPGVFEETGRLVAYKTVLKNRKNRETSISYGIGHGLFEVMFVIGATFITYFVYAMMINSGTFGSVIDAALAKAPAQADAIYSIVDQIRTASFGYVAVVLYERVFAVLYHIGASVLVFYACKDKKKFWLYPLAIVIHTILDGMIGLGMAGVIHLSSFATEAFMTVVGSLTFFGAYFLLYKKDKQ